jgi:hypothetical protein
VLFDFCLRYCCVVGIIGVVVVSIVVVVGGGGIDVGGICTVCVC